MMNISYYALGKINDLKDDGLTMLNMNHGEIGVMKFNNQDESFRHNDNSITLKSEIAAFNKGFEDGNVGKDEYYRNVAKWCSNVEHFANEWMPNCVAFDIRDAYNDCITEIGRTRKITWPKKVPIPMGELSDKDRNVAYASYTHI